MTVPAHFHARFSATARRYQYVILESERAPAIARQYVTWSARPLDDAAMHGAAQLLVGEHDFTSFRSRRVPVQVAVSLRLFDCGAAFRRSRRASTSPPTHSCITWCATSPARCCRSAAASATPAWMGERADGARSRARRSHGAADRSVSRRRPVRRRIRVSARAAADDSPSRGRRLVDYRAFSGLR